MFAAKLVSLIECHLWDPHGVRRVCSVGFTNYCLGKAADKNAARAEENRRRMNLKKQKKAKDSKRVIEAG